MLVLLAFRGKWARPLVHVGEQEPKVEVEASGRGTRASRGCAERRDETVGGRARHALVRLGTSCG
jgi:hypothetical protein